jgi:hypothetical protein
MAKIVYNECYGGFGLSEEAQRLYTRKVCVGEFEFIPDGKMCSAFVNSEFPILNNPAFRLENKILKGTLRYPYRFYDGDVERDDPSLVEVVEELGFEKASGKCARLRIAEVSKGSLWKIESFDGNEDVITNEYNDWKVAMY